MPANYPSGDDSGDKCRDSQDLGRVYAIVTHHEGTHDNDVLGYVRVKTPRVNNPITSTMPAITLSKVGSHCSASRIHGDKRRVRSGIYGACSVAEIADSLSLKTSSLSRRCSRRLT